MAKLDLDIPILHITRSDGFCKDCANRAAFRITEESIYETLDIVVCSKCLRKRLANDPKLMAGAVVDLLDKDLRR